MRRKVSIVLAVFVLSIFTLSVAMETSAWARAGGGSSSGSRGSRSFSSPSMPSRPSPSSPSPSMPQKPGYGAPGANPYQSPSRGWFGGSPFWQGIAGGVAGGFLGNMLFGSRSYGYGMGGGFGGSGFGLIELIVLGALIYFGFKLLRRRRVEQSAYYEDSRTETFPGGSSPYYAGSSPPFTPQLDEVERGVQDIRSMDPSFNLESFKETAEDMFFRIQAGWMNRSLDGIENMVSPEMRDYFRIEFARMIQQGRINRLENIAVRKVEPSEIWQEEGKDFFFVFFTANLLDYTVDDQSGKVVDGDKLSPVKFQEFWTFCRDIGTRQWQLAAINQIGEPSSH